MSEPDKISLEAVPLLCEGVDIKKLNISPAEGFILSQVDGQLRVRHLKTMMGLEEEPLFRLIRDLVEKGAIMIHHPRPKPAAGKLKITGKGIINPKAVPTGAQFSELVTKLVGAIDRVDYFQLLGVSEKATREEIKKAYFQLSKIFHPDRYFRKGSPEFGHQLQVIFKRINTAYQVLSSDERKREYLVQLAQKGVEFAVEELELEVAKKVYTGPKWKLGLREEDRVKAKDEKLQKMVDKIRHSALGGQLQKAGRLFELAVEEIQKKNFKSARTSLKLASQLDPSGAKKYSDELNRIEQIEQGLRGETAYQDGRAAQEAGDFQRASRFYNEALTLTPKHPPYLYSLAEVMVKYLNNFEKGRAVLIQLLELDAKRPDYFYLLGLAYVGLGQQRAAEVQLEKALELDPKHREAQKELKALRKA